MQRDILATCIEDQAALFRVVPILKVEHLFGEQDGLIYEAMLALVAQHLPVDLNTVRSQLKATGKLERAGGTNYLAGLTENRPVVKNVETYADRIVEMWEHREFQTWAASTYAESYDVADFRTYRAEKQRQLAKITFARSSASRLEHVAATVEASMSGAQQRRRGRATMAGTPTGYAGLDKLTGGMAAGTHWVVAGRSGQGKTSAILGMAANITRPVSDDEPLWVPRRGVALFELEMSRIEVVDRMICMGSGVPLPRWRNGPISDEDMAYAGQVATTIYNSTLWIDESPPYSIGIEEIEAKVLALKAEYDRPATFAGCPICSHDLDHSAEIDRWFCPVCHPDPRSADALVHEDRVQLTREHEVVGAMVDHIGLQMTNPDAPSRQRQIAEITGGSKAMAKRQRIWVCNVAQLNREPDKRQGKDQRPKLSDLKDSGSIEEDADVVLFPYRPGYYKPDDIKLRNVAEFIVAKQRNGPPGVVDMRYVPECSRFDDIDGSLPPGL